MNTITGFLEPGVIYKIVDKGDNMAVKCPVLLEVSGDTVEVSYTAKPTYDDLKTDASISAVGIYASWSLGYASFFTYSGPGTIFVAGISVVAVA